MGEDRGGGGDDQKSRERGDATTSYDLTSEKDGKTKLRGQATGGARGRPDMRDGRLAAEMAGSA